MEPVAAIDWGTVAQWAAVIVVAGGAIIALLSLVVALGYAAFQSIKDEGALEFLGSVIGFVLFLALVFGVLYGLSELLSDGSPETTTGGITTTTEAGFCETHQCIDNFEEGNGYKVQCADNMWSHSGGIQGVCSGHGGVK